MITVANQQSKFKNSLGGCSHSGAAGDNGGGAVSEGNKCPMGKHPWLAMFLALAFILVFLASKLGLL
jgi:hypothetical protein